MWVYVSVEVCVAYLGKLTSRLCTTPGPSFFFSLLEQAHFTEKSPGLRESITTSLPLSSSGMTDTDPLMMQ